MVRFQDEEGFLSAGVDVLEIRAWRAPLPNTKTRLGITSRASINKMLKTPRNTQGCVASLHRPRSRGEQILFFFIN